MTHSCISAPTNHAERIKLVNLSSKDQKSKVNYQVACDKLLEQGEKPFLEFVESLLPEERQLLAYHLGNDGKLLIHRICSGTNSSTAKIINGLHELGCVDAALPSRDGMYPLHILATLPSLTQAFNALLSCGADPDVKVMKTGNTAGHLIATRLDFDMLSILKDYDVDFTIENKEEKTVSDIIKSSGTEQDYINWISISASIQLMKRNLVADTDTELNTEVQPKRSARSL